MQCSLGRSYTSRGQMREDAHDGLEGGGTSKRKVRNDGKTAMCALTGMAHAIIQLASHKEIRRKDNGQQRHKGQVKLFRSRTASLLQVQASRLDQVGTSPTMQSLSIQNLQACTKKGMPFVGPSFCTSCCEK